FDEKCEKRFQNSRVRLEALGLERSLATSVRPRQLILPIHPSVPPHSGAVTRASTCHQSPEPASERSGEIARSAGPSEAGTDDHRRTPRADASVGKRARLGRSFLSGTLAFPPNGDGLARTDGSCRSP